MTCHPGCTSMHVSTNSFAYCSSRGSLMPPPSSPVRSPLSWCDGASSCLLQDALWERNDQDLARRLLENVIDGRREEARLPSPARCRAEDDQVGSGAPRLLDDRLSDRAGTHGGAAYLHPMIGAE